MTTRVLALLVMMSVLATACAPAPPAPSITPASAAPHVDIVRFAWPDAGVLNPFRVSTLGPGGLVLLTLVYDSLVWKDEHGLIPWLATEWEVSPDGLDYSFTLRTDVRWQDGQPLTAEDVAFTFAYFAQHPFRWQSTAMVETATRVGADRVRVHLKQPYAAFLDEVAGVVPIIPRHVWLRVTDPEHYDASDSTLGSGPYRLVEYRAAEAAYRLVANPTYFHGNVSIQEFQQLNIPPETRVQTLQQRQLELIQSSDAAVAEIARNDRRLSVFETPPLSIVRLALNTTRAPLDRKEVRQALAYAIDRARIAEIVTRAPPIVGSFGVVPPETPWFNPNLPRYGLDVDRARALLGGHTYTLELLADATYREPELLGPMLQAVGITLTVKRADAKTRTQLLREGSFELAEVQHLGVGGDPDFLRRWSAGEEANDYAQGWTFRDPEFVRLAREQSVTLDPAQRKELVSRMQAILADELPTIPLYYRRFYWVYDAQKYTPMNTWGGLMNGLPFVQNKLTFLRK